MPLRERAAEWLGVLQAAGAPAGAPAARTVGAAALPPAPAGPPPLIIYARGGVTDHQILNG